MGGFQQKLLYRARDLLGTVQSAKGKIAGIGRNGRLNDGRETWDGRPLHGQSRYSSLEDGTGKIDERANGKLLQTQNGLSHNKVISIKLEICLKWGRAYPLVRFPLLHGDRPGWEVSRSRARAVVGLISRPPESRREKVWEGKH